MPVMLHPAISAVAKPADTIGIQDSGFIKIPEKPRPSGRGGRGLTLSVGVGCEAFVLTPLYC
jgi:hypothetical protein